MSKCYIARCPGCGEIVAAMVKGIMPLKEEAKEISSWIKQGDDVEIVDSENTDITVRSCRCDVHKVHIDNLFSGHQTATR